MTVTTLAEDRLGRPIQRLGWGTVENLAITNSASAQSAALSSETKVVRLCATVDTWVLIGANPVADSTAGVLVGAYREQEVRLPAGLAAPKVAGRAVSAANGVLSIAQCNDS